MDAAEEYEDERGGVIQNVQALGGIIAMQILREDGKVEVVKGDNGPTVRALMGVFGEEIVSGHSLDVSKVIGQQVRYDTDDLGLLAYIAPGS